MVFGRLAGPQIGRWLRVRWQQGAGMCLLALAAAVGLKGFFSQAGASELEWILAPSCALAAGLGGIELLHEPGAGYISHAQHMVVGPACAGVNFLVVAILSIFFASQADFAGSRRKLAWLCASVLIAFAATVLTNGLRIVLAARLYDLDIYAGWLTKARMHRLLGVTLYSAALLAVCRVAEACSAHGHPGGGLVPRPRSRHAQLAPFYWYAGVAVGIPLANRAALTGSDRFLEHALLVLGVSFAMAGISLLPGALADRLQSRGQRPPGRVGSTPR
jgi:exosortase K